MRENALVILVKNIEFGKVKTRVAASVGHKKAMDIYIWLLTHLKDIILSWKGKRFLYYSKFVDKNDDWDNAHFDKRIQHKGDIGQRMSQAFEQTLHTSKSVVLIGSDCPEISTDILSDAFLQLAHHDVVIGPAKDGGYYLIGISEFHPELFKDIAWSTSQVLQQTIDCIEQLGLKHKLLETLSDIDTIEDWEAFQSRYHKT